MKKSRYTPEERLLLLTKLTNRTETLVDFAKKECVSVATLYKWQRDSGISALEPARFEQLEPTNEPFNCAYQFQINGIELIFDRLPPAEWMSDFVKRLLL